MNLAVVLKTSWAVARSSRSAASTAQASWSAATPGTDPRSSPQRNAEVAAQGSQVTLLFAAVPTPVVAFAAPESRR